MKNVFIAFTVCITVNLSCNHPDKKPIVLSVTPEIIPQSDTVITNLSSYKLFDDITLGLSLSDWNKMIAIKTRDNQFDEIVEEGARYIGWKYEDERFGLGYQLKPAFDYPSRKVNDTVLAVSMDKIRTKEPYVSEVIFEFNRDFNWSANRIQTWFIHKLNLEREAGSALQLTRDPVTVPDIYYNLTISSVSNKQLNEPSGFPQGPQTKSFEKNYISLFSNKDFYVVFKVNDYQTCSFEVQNYDIENIKLKSAVTYMIVQIFPRTFTQIDIREYMTFKEKADWENKVKNESLIQKSLKKNN